LVKERGLGVGRDDSPDDSLVATLPEVADAEADFKEDE
jgi:hypothetical protein